MCEKYCSVKLIPSDSVPAENNQWMLVHVVKNARDSVRPVSERCPTVSRRPPHPFVSLRSRFTEVRTNGNSTWRTASWIWTGETMSSPKPSGTPNGEEEKAKTKKKKKQTKTQEQELANSFYPVRRHFNILPYPVTGFVSGNFCRVFENSRQTQRTVRYCLKKKKILGVLERHSTSLAGWKPYRGRNSLRTERSLSFLGFFCASSRRLVLFLPREYSLESERFTSCRCSGPEWPDRPPTSRGQGSFIVTP